MSARRSAVTVALAAVVLAIGALLAVALMPAPGAHAVQPDAADRPAPVVVEYAPVDPFLAALLGEGTELPANAEELSLAADRVCEGFAAGESVLSMSDVIAVEFGVDDEQARHFVNTAGVVRCSA